MDDLTGMSHDDLVKRGYIVVLERYDKKTKETKRTPYQTVAYRLALFRKDHPDWIIQSKTVERYEKSVLVGCTILDTEGNARSYAEAEEPFNSRFPSVEKASTDAIGRALSYLGYATASLASYDEMLKVEVKHNQNRNNGRNRNAVGEETPNSQDQDEKNKLQDEIWDLGKKLGMDVSKVNQGAHYYCGRTVIALEKAGLIKLRDILRNKVNGELEKTEVK